jgi:hypothetical protein
MYMSEPNDKGQFVWVPVAESMTKRVVSLARTYARNYGPTVAHKAIHAAARHAYTRLVPGGNFDNSAAAVYGPQYYDAYHNFSKRPNRFYASYY